MRARNIRLACLIVVMFCSMLGRTGVSLAGVMIVAPHPDDEVIMASGVIQRARDTGEQVTVVYLSNGDADGIQQGLTRQEESVNALVGRLGLLEEDLIFLSYPDGNLEEMCLGYPQEVDIYTTPSGQSATYGVRGLGRSDYHSYRFGVPANYNCYNLVGDLTDIVATYQPDHVIVPSGFDTHPDHQQAYALFLQALSALPEALAGYFPQVHSTVVHAFSGSWPAAKDAAAYHVEVPGLALTELSWEARESLDVPLSMQSISYALNAKYLAISEEVTQQGAAGYLGGFIHKDEIFWVENPRGSNAPPRVEAGQDQDVLEGVVVVLNGSSSVDPDGDPLTFQWRQTGGTPVALSDPGAATPSFVAPLDLADDACLTFELRVSDGQFVSLADLVAVRVGAANRSYFNVAPGAVVTASTEETTAGHLAIKAVDGVVDGYPSDGTREWATTGEGSAAWILLEWPSPRLVDKVVLFDRPNLSDQILGATLSFSDGTSVPVGSLDNAGRATEVPFPPKLTNRLRLTVTVASVATRSAGLAELQVFGTADVGGNAAPLADAGPDQSVREGELVQLDGSASSDANGDTLTFQWTQVGGIPVSLSDPSSPAPTFIAPSGLLQSQTQTFQLTVSDGRLSSAPDTVSVGTHAATGIGIIAFEEVADLGITNPIYQPGYLYPRYIPQLGATVNDLYLPGLSDGVLELGEFRFSGQHFHVITLPGAQNYGGAPDNGSKYLYSEGGAWGKPITMAMREGRPFALLGLDTAGSFEDAAAAAAGGFPVAQEILLDGLTVGGDTLRTSLRLDGSPDFQGFVLPPEWTNLESVTFTGLTAGGTVGGFALDNMSIDAGPSVVSLSNNAILVNGMRFATKGVVYSPVPIGAGQGLAGGEDDYFTPQYHDGYARDLALLRAMGANTVRLVGWASMADHRDFLDTAYNNAVNPVYVIAGYRVDAGLDIDAASPTNVREYLKADFRAMVAAHKEHPAILMWAIGSDLNSPGVYGNQLTSLFSLIEEMSAVAHQEEGFTAHPVTVQLADHELVQTIGAYDASVPSLDAWGASVYRGNSFGTLFSDVRAVSSKPLVVLGFGIDAYDASRGLEYENAGIPYQADFAESLWNEIATNADICVGGAVMEYSDGWWRGALLTDPACAGSDPTVHDDCGSVDATHPDGFSNIEWWGIVRNAPSGSYPDAVEPRAVYHRLQSLWTQQAVALKVNGDAAYTRSALAALELSCVDGSQCLEMSFSNDGMSWSTPVPYASTSSWWLTSWDGAKTVLVRVRDAAGNWYAGAPDSIVLDHAAPITTATPGGGTYAGSRSVSLSCSDGSGSGCERTYYTTDGSEPTAASGVYAGPILVAASTTLRYFSVDRSGNAEAARTQGYTLGPDVYPPSGSVTINGGAAYCRSGGATLTLSCSDDVGCAQMQFSSDNATWSTPQGYAGSKTWLLSPGGGEKRVYVRYADGAGNWSAAFFDTIVMDITNPATAVAPVGGTYAGSQSVSLSCSDGSGSGCERTYYTTDGSVPTTASGVYAGPILIAASTTLRYFSVDVAGNADGVRAQSYTIAP